MWIVSHIHLFPHFHDRITSLRRKVSAHITSLTLQHVIVAHVPSQESQQYCNWVLVIIDLKKIGFASFYGISFLF